MANAESFWNEQYQKSPFQKGKEPSPFLLEMLPRMRTGKVLDVGMGEGRNAVYLAQKGYSVKGFDASQTAVEHAQTLARDTGVSIDAQRVDLDLFLFGLMEYDSIVMTFFKPPTVRYYSEMIRALKQGGTLLVESWMIEELTEIIGPEESYRDFYFRPNELLNHLKGMRILFYQEGLVGKRHVVQCLAQKPVDKDVAKFGLFDMQSSGSGGSKDAGPSIHQKLAEELFKKK